MLARPCKQAPFSHFVTVRWVSRLLAPACGLGEQATVRSPAAAARLQWCTDRVAESIRAPAGLPGWSEPRPPGLRLAAAAVAAAAVAEAGPGAAGAKTVTVTVPQ
jgi:hypothetical protein